MIFGALLLLSSVWISLQQMCPMNEMMMTECNSMPSPLPGGVWISNVREDVGSSEDGTTFGITWNPDLLNPSQNYSIVIRESETTNSARALMATDRTRFTIRNLEPNFFYEVMVCREGFEELDFSMFHPQCGNCRFCFQTERQSQTTDIIIGAVVGGVVFLGLVIVLIVILCCICKLKKKKLDKIMYLDEIRTPKPLTTPGNKEEQPTQDTSWTPQSRLMQNLPKSLIIDPNEIQIGKIIGQGEFGVVYRGCMKSDLTDVAIKTVKGIFATDNDIENLSQEILKMIQFDHPNVMSLIGVCTAPSSQTNLATGLCVVVMPFMARGSLLDQLRQRYEEIVILDQEDKTVPTVKKHLTQMCLQIAKGMEYLTDLKFLHRDLAARNCLVDINGIIKVSDFGLAEDIYSQNYFRQSSGSTKLPIKWMSIESINQGKFTEKTDVWSYGVTCWEIFTGGTIPYPGIHPREVVEYLENGERLKKPKNAACEAEIFSMMQSCWKHQDSARPTFSEIVSLLERHLECTMDYLDLSCSIRKKPLPVDKTSEQAEEVSMSPIPEPKNLPKTRALPNDYYYSS